MNTYRVISRGRAWGGAAAAGALAALAWTTAAAVPAAFTYTGELWAENGLPYTGAVEVGVAIYTQDAGGEAIWTRPTDTAMVSGGLLEVEFTSNELLGLFAQQPNLWLAFTIDSEALEPRQRLTSVPYAAAAGDAKTLGGMPPESFLPAGEPVGMAELPSNGLGQVSNGALNNEFANVTWAWGGSAQPIIDAPAPGTSASVTTAETGSSYLTDLTVYTQHTLTFPNVVRLRLFPPASTGLGPITLFEGSRGAGTYAESWTAGNTAELAALLGTKVEGQWTFEVTDTDDNAAAGFQVGELLAFSIAYDVVRSDHLELAGRLDIDGPLTVAGDVAVAGVVHSKVIAYSGYCSQHTFTNGFAAYCLDSTSYNTATEYLSASSAGTVTIERAGWYEVRFQAWQYNTCGTRNDAYLQVNGVLRRGSENVPVSSGPSTANIALTAPLLVGDELRIDVRTSCANQGNNYGAHLGPNWSSLDIRYLGE